MTAYRMTLVARRDIETLVRALARDDVRAAERAVDELCATMEWLAGTPDVGPLRSDLVDDEQAAGGAPRVRLWALRDWLLVYGEPAPGPEGDPLAEEPPPGESSEGSRPEGEPAEGVLARPSAGPGSPPRGSAAEPITVLRVLETQRPRWG